jgi:hypothetical protein
MAAVDLVTGDLLNQDVEVIVNAWNRNIIPWWLLLPQGVSGAIKKRAGYQPFREVAKYGPIPLGGAVLTSAGRLPFKGPSFGNRGWHRLRDLLLRRSSSCLCRRFTSWFGGRDGDSLGPRFVCTQWYCIAAPAM